MPEVEPLGSNEHAPVYEKYGSSAIQPHNTPGAESNRATTNVEDRVRDAAPRLDHDMSNFDHGPPGDFDDEANGLWSLYGKEAKAYDEAMIQTRKGDMDGILLFAGLFSTALTAFLVQSYLNLQPDPAKETAFYGQQAVVMLSQISQQIAAIAPQSSVQLTPPGRFPPSIRRPPISESMSTGS
ncbi:hypothetical protein BC834DRAFT_973529 [Gloeopeniophorella convolvens]|nr:hypothetical protein BC834DRAFT_973529 [Gloeopeniophorella convolvens]